MDLVYIIGNGSKWSNNEIRYSLRSVEKFGQNIDKVFIVGELPSFLKNVIHIPCEDPYTKKYNNAWYKLSKFCSEQRTKFVLMNDDFFLLKPINFNSIPLYYDKTIDDLVNSYNESTTYSILQEYTKEVLLQLDKTSYNYAIHAPITIDPNRILFWMYLLKDTPNISFRNFYGNVCCQQDIRVELQDLKFNRIVDLTEFKTLTKDKNFFSIGDNFLDNPGKRLLDILYPTPSIFEK